MPYTSTRKSDQCRDNCAEDCACTLSKRMEHKMHVCGDFDCSCHATYHRRVNAWIEHHIVMAPHDYAKAQAAYLLWQAHPAYWSGSQWLRDNTPTPANTPEKAR